LKFYNKNINLLGMLRLLINSLFYQHVFLDNI
jgi:hypothetical protein